MTTFLALLTGGGLLAAGSLLGGLISDRQAAKRDDRKYAQDEKMAIEARSHEHQMALEARRQDRLEQAYVELGTYLSRYGDWARSVQPFWGAPAAPEPLPPEDRWRIETLVKAHGSPEVQRLLDQWSEHAKKIENADTLVRSVEQSSNPSEELDREAMREKHAVPDYRTAMYQAAEAIRNQMHEELTGGDGGPHLPDRA